MGDKPTTRLSSKKLSPHTKGGVPSETAEEIERLQVDLIRYREALENIRDQTFELANSPRLIDQLWHFVRWSKATARGALEKPGEAENK